MDLERVNFLREVKKLQGQIIIKSVQFQVTVNATFGDLKAQVQNREGIPIEKQRLVFRGRQMGGRWKLTPGREWCTVRWGGEFDKSQHRS